MWEFDINKNQTEFLHAGIGASVLTKTAFIFILHARKLAESIPKIKVQNTKQAEVARIAGQDVAWVHVKESLVSM